MSAMNPQSQHQWDVKLKFELNSLITNERNTRCWYDGNSHIEKHHINTKKAHV